MRKDIAIVIPVFNESGNIDALFAEIEHVMHDTSYEVIFVNDGSTDTTQKAIEKLYQKHKQIVKGIELLKQSGKAAALHAGFIEARGDIIFTLDGDLQDDPREIPRFLKKLDEGYDVVSGWKQKRKDSFIKNNTSKIFNAATNIISPVKLHDFNCGFKAYRWETVKDLSLYGELHRYIPVLIAAKGYKVTEIPVNHRERLSGKSKYGISRFLHGFLDLVTVTFITKFHSRPLHLFGYMGFGFFTLGFIFGLYLTYLRFFQNATIGDRPLLLLSVMLMIMGVQIGITGIIGEQIADMRYKNDKNYIVKKVVKSNK